MSALVKAVSLMRGQGGFESVCLPFVAKTFSLGRSRINLRSLEALIHVVHNAIYDARCLRPVFAPYRVIFGVEKNTSASFREVPVAQGAS